MDYYGPSTSSNNRRATSGAPPRNGYPSSIAARSTFTPTFSTATATRPTMAAIAVRPPMRPMSPLIFNYGGIKIQEVINEQYRFNSQQKELEIGQHILLDNFWSIRFHPQNLEIGQEKLVKALEQEFAIKNRAFVQATEQHRKTLA